MISLTDLAIDLFFTVALVAAFLATAYGISAITEPIKAILQKRRVRRFLASLPGNLDFTVKDGFIQIFDVNTGEDVRGVWVNTL